MILILIFNIKYSINYLIVHFNKDIYSFNKSIYIIQNFVINIYLENKITGIIDDHILKILNSFMLKFNFFVSYVLK